MAITEIEPRALVEAHKSGDGDAFETIVRAHHQALFAHALTRLRDVQAAEDAVQETFVRAYRAMPDFEGDFHLRAWLHRILTNVCHDEGARRQRDGRLFDRVSGQAVTSIGPVELDDERMDFSREVVAAALDSLPASYREALTLRYVEDLPYERVAAATGVSEGNARIRVMRARTALRRALTSSHAVVIALVPWLRRPGRGSAVDLPALAPSIAPSVGTTASIAPSIAPSVGATASVAAAAPSIVAQAPLLLRAADHAPQLVERAASIPQVLGLVAAMAVPIGAPVVSNQVSSWATPPPAVAAPAPGAPVTGGAPVPPAVPPAAPGATSPAAGVAAAGSVLAGGSVGAALAAAASGVPPVPTTVPLTPVAGTDSGTSAPSAPSGTSATPTTPPSAGPPPMVPPTPPRTSKPPPVAPTAPDRTPAPVAAPPVDPDPVAFRSTMSGTSVMDVARGSAELTGTVTWDVGEAGVTGQLTGTISVPTATEPPSGAAPPAHGPPDGSFAERGRPSHAGPPAHAGRPSHAGPPPHEPVVVPPTAFSGALAISLHDGRTFSLRIVDGSLDPAGARARFQLLDACDGVVASGALAGTLGVGPTSEPSGFELELEGERLAEAPACG